MKKLIYSVCLIVSIGGLSSKATTAEDYIGIYTWKGTSLLLGTASIAPELLCIKADSNDASKMIIEGLVKDHLLEAIFDASTGNLIVPNQSIYYNERYEKEVWFWNYTARNVLDSEGNSIGYDYYRNVKSPFFFSIDENGHLLSGDVNVEDFNNHRYSDSQLAEKVCIATQIVDEAPDINELWLMSNINGNKVNYFEFNANEWERIGNARFKDAWFYPYWTEGLDEEYEVPLYASKKVKDQFLLYNPYGPETPFGKKGYTDNSQKGFLLFDVSDPSCVVFYPFVKSFSLQYDYGKEGSNTLNIAICCFNNEGYNFYVEDATKEDIASGYRAEGLNVSTFDNTTGMVYIFNPRMLENESIKLFFWFEEKYPEVFGYIKFPGFPENNGVESLETEDSQESPVYYNLQGIRVDQPESGIYLQIENGKARKVIK